MAIQNFLSGGYYGKLGDTVGQRWHNKRTIRVYVVPYNPRTEKQQANRHLFGHATQLSKMAFRINRGDPLWDTSEKGQFSQLVQTALRRLKAGMSDAEAIPLYPDGYDPNIILSNVSSNWSSWPNSVTIAAGSYIMSEDRRFEIFISCKDEHTGNNVILTFEQVITAGSTFSFTFIQDMRYSLPPGSSISATTIDNAQHGGSSISLPVYALSQPSRPICTINITYSAHEYDSNEDVMFLYAYDLPYIPEDLPIIEARVWDLYDGAWGYAQTEGRWEPDGRLTNAIYSEGQYDFRSGCYIYAGTEDAETDTCYQKLTWGRYDFSK